MTFELICDSCGKRTAAPTNQLGDPINPSGWYSRVVNGKIQHACSRECIEKLGGIVLPV